MKIISTRPCLRVRTNLGPRIAFWGLIWVQFWSLFWVPFLGPVLGPLILFVIVAAQNGAQKWNPKQGPKYDPNHDPKMQSGAPNLYGHANKDSVEMIFIQRSAGRSDSIVQQTNNFSQRRKGNGAQKWNPKQGPKYDPNHDPKMQSGAPNLY